jgi:chitodextrinase
VSSVSYDVYRGGRKAATTDRLAARVDGLAPGTRYSLSVVARDSAGNASPRSAAVVTRTCKATRRHC